MDTKFSKAHKITAKEEVALRHTKNQKQAEAGFIVLCKKIILFGVFFILFTPLIINGNFLFPFVSPKSFYFMGLVLIIFTTYLLLISLSPKYRPSTNVLLIAIAIFIVATTISSLLGENLAHSFWSGHERMTGLLMLFHCLAFFVVLSSVFKNQSEWFKIFQVSIFAAVIMSIVSLFLKAGINFMGQFGPMSQGGAFIGNSSFMGTYLVFNIFLALYLFLKTSGNLKIYSGTSLMIIFLALLRSDARAAILSLFGGLILLFIFWLIVHQKARIKLVGASLFGILVTGTSLITWLAFQPGSFVNERLAQMGFSARFLVWGGAWQGILERPWFGWGLENFGLVFAREFNPLLFLPQYGGEIWFDKAHNIIVDTLVTTGAVGLLAYFGIFVAAFYLLWSRYLRSKICFITAGIFSVILIAYFIQNLTVFDMVSSLMMFFLVLGFIANVGAGEKEDIFKTNVNRLNVPVTIIILIFFSFSLFHFVIQPVKAMHYISRAWRAVPFSAQRTELYQKSLAASPLGREQARMHIAQNALRFFQEEIGREASTEDIEAKFNFLSQELEHNIYKSVGWRSYLILGDLYIAYAQINPTKLVRASEVAKQAIKLSPNNPQGYWLLVRIKLEQGDYDAAIALAKQAVEIEPRISHSHFILVYTAMMRGDIMLAQEKAEAAIKINPAWEPRLQEILNM